MQSGLGGHQESEPQRHPQLPSLRGQWGERGDGALADRAETSFRQERRWPEEPYRSPLLAPRVAELRNRYSPYHQLYNHQRSQLGSPRRSSSLTNSPVQFAQQPFPNFPSENDMTRRELRRHESWPTNLRLPERRPTNDLSIEHELDDPDGRLRSSSTEIGGAFSQYYEASSSAFAFRDDTHSPDEEHSDGVAVPWIAGVGRISMNDNSPAVSPRGDNAEAKQTGTTPPIPTTNKPSRYLREMDRRIILSRLAKGEKQAALAKEYQVSRSTICNLFKQRDIVLARKDENPLSRHPKKNRYLLANTEVPRVGFSAVSVSSTVPVAANQADDLEEKRAEPTDFFSFSDEVVIEVDSRAISLLKTRIHSRDTTDDEFKRCCARLTRLLIEESLAVVASRSPHRDEDASGSSRSLCAISMELSGRSMLDAFRAIEPDRLTGSIRRTDLDTALLALHDAHHSHDLTNFEVLLLDVVIASGDAVCAAIDSLRAHGVKPEQVAVVALFVAPEVVALVQYAHPQVRILSAGIDHQLHTRVNKSDAASASSSRVFLERYRRVVGL